MSFTNIKDVNGFIAGLVMQKVDAGQRVKMEWTAAEVLNELDNIEGADVDFYLITARHYIIDQVKRCVGKFEVTVADVSGQIVMDGFEHLQKAYPMDRGDGRELIPIGQLTDDEIKARSQEYVKGGEALIRHGFELIQYMRSRAQAA